MNHLAISMLIVAVMSCAGSKPDKEIRKSSSRPNEVVLVLHRIDSDVKPSKKFPLYDTIRLPLKTVTTITGSVTSLNLDFANDNDGMSTLFSLFIPAAPKLRWGVDSRVDMALKDATLPYTVSGDDYHPFPNALDGGDVNANISLQNHSHIAENRSYLGFNIEEISIQSMQFKQGVANMEMSLKLSSLGVTDAIYGKFSADVFIYVKDFEVETIMVD